MVERLVLEARKTAFDVNLDHINAVADAAEYALMIDLDTVTENPLGFAQIVQQLSIATTEVEHALAVRDPVGDDGKVKTFAFFGGKVHTEIFSRYARKTAW